MLRTKNGVSRTNGSYTKMHKRILIHCGEWTKILINVFQHIYTTLNITKLTWVTQMYSSIFALKNGINSGIILINVAMI